MEKVAFPRRQRGLDSLESRREDGEVGKDGELFELFVRRGIWLGIGSEC